MRLLLILVILLAGCSSVKPEESSKWLLPVNAAVGYFGALGIHESGHAVTAYGIGGDDIEIEMFPSRTEDGDIYLGRTTADLNDPSEIELTLFHTMGPTATFVSHVGFRQLLRTGQVPKHLQPTIAWLSLTSQISYYYHVSLGLARANHADLGKEDVWISIVMLAGGLLYDFWDFFTDKKDVWFSDRYFGVLFGEKFYEPGEERFTLLTAPLDGGGFLGFRWEW
jgi:hypothetical protein